MTDLHYTDPILRSGADERDYLLRRAQDHGRLAGRTAEPGSRIIHLRLQQLYAERAAVLSLVVPD